MTDLVERLRSWRSRADGLMVDDCDEAADEIEEVRQFYLEARYNDGEEIGRLRAKLAKAVEALRKLRDEEISGRYARTFARAILKEIGGSDD